jgi:hypothetical protein
MLSRMSFVGGRYPMRPRPPRAHAFVVGMTVGAREVVRVTTTRVLLECKCGAVSAVPIRRLESEAPQSCRRCAPKVPAGQRGAVSTMKPGDRFGSRVVVGVRVRTKAEGGTVVAVRCDCGTEGETEPRKLVAGLYHHCPRCADPLRVSKRVKAMSAEVQDLSGLGVVLTSDNCRPRQKQDRSGHWLGRKTKKAK